MLSFNLSQRAFRLSVLALIAAAALAVLFLGWQNHEEVEAEHVERLRQQMDVRLGLVQNELAVSASQVGFLHSTPPIEGIVRAVANNGFDAQEDTPLPLWQRRLATIFKAFAEQNPNIAQIRYVGAADQGREIVRVQRQGEAVIVVTDAQLQQKGRRLYFRIAEELAPGETYLSPINLNREQGEIEQPPWPTYRVLKKVLDQRGEFFGFVIINYDARHLFARVTDALAPELALFLLNGDKQFLLDTERARAFAWEYDETSTWEAAFEVAKADDDGALWVQERLLDERDRQKRYLYLEKPLASPNSLPLPQLYLGLAFDTALIRAQTRNRVLGSFALVLIASGTIFLILFLYRRYSAASREEMAVKARLQALVNGSKDAIVTMDMHGRATSFNQATCDMFELTREALSYQPFLAKVIPDEQRAQAHALFYKVLDNHDIPSFEVARPGRDGEYRYFEFTLSPKISDHDEIFGVAAIVRDVTTAHVLRESLQALNQKLKQKNKEMEQFVYTVSHDLKAPLVTISGFSRKIIATEEQALSEKNRHRLNRIMANISHMEALLNELLNLSRIIHRELTIADCDIESCVKETLELLETKITEQEATIRTHFDCQTLRANKSLLVQSLQNLIGNALNYRRQDVPLEIDITATCKDDVVILEVKDNGLGIAHKYHEKIFKLFERMSERKGTGVGLTIVKSVMERHQGWVELESEEGKGSRFRLHFPQTKLAAEAPLSQVV